MELVMEVSCSRFFEISKKLYAMPLLQADENNRLYLELVISLNDKGDNILIIQTSFDYE